MKYKYLVLLLLVIGQKSYSQDATDTAALVKEFTKIMSFTARPYLSYTTVTKMDAQPLLNDKDTISSNGVFYKSDRIMYCNTTKDEMYVEDSLVVRINNDNKTIWISRADATSKEKLKMPTLSTKQILETMKRNYTITKTKIANDVYRISLDTRRLPHSNSTTSASIDLEYSEETELPRSLSITMSMKQPASEEMLAQLENEGIDKTKLLQNIGGINYIVTTQRMNVFFSDISIHKEKLTQIPSYKDKVAWNATTRHYTGKGKYEEYDITKTF